VTDLGFLRPIFQTFLSQPPGIPAQLGLTENDEVIQADKHQVSFPRC
jgi:hypothetical protein